jgi:hypothetical protein
MRVAELDEVNYDLEVDGVEVRRTLRRQVWERGAWATVAVVYQERAADGPWRPAKLAVVRLQRVREAWKRHAAISLRGDDAVALGQALAAWSAELALGSDAGADDGSQRVEPGLAKPAPRRG